MFIFSKRLLVILTFTFVLCASYAQCNFDSLTFEDKLISDENEDGFPNSLITVEPSQVMFSCEGSPVVLKILPPIRAKNGGPELKGPFTSYFIYQGKRYTNKQQLVIEDTFSNRTISLGMTIQNKGEILPASDDYKYTTQLSVTDLD